MGDDQCPVNSLSHKLPPVARISAGILWFGWHVRQRKPCESQAPTAIATAVTDQPTAIGDPLLKWRLRGSGYDPSGGEGPGGTAEGLATRSPEALTRGLAPVSLALVLRFASS